MTLLHHQTTRLVRGAHASPVEGTCVMELASLLADEPFSDHPECVSPVVGAFLREYNDRIDDRRRQDLRSYAAAIIGSRGEPATEVTRARRCLQWAAARRTRYGPSFLTRLLVRGGRRVELAGVYAGAAAWGVRRTDAAHAGALRFLDELIGIGNGTARSPVQIERRVPDRCTAS
jgi:hypothetical protein